MLLFGVCSVPWSVRGMFLFIGVSCGLLQKITAARERAASGPCVAVEVIRMDVDDTFEEEQKG